MIMKHFLSLKNVWLVLFFVTISTTISAQPPWSYSITSGNHTILVPPGTVTVDGNPLSVGDYIGVFYDQAGTPACGGFIDYSGGMTAVTAWTADGGDNGFNPGETFQWKVWIASTNTVVDMTATYQASGFPNTDAFAVNGMSGIAAMTGTSGGSLPLSATFAQTDVTCYGVCTGAIDVTPSDGTAPYSFAWSNGATDEDLTSLCAGTYDVTVSDDASASVVLNITIVEPTEISATFTLSDYNGYAVSAFGASDGTITTNTSGGTAPYSYAWSNGATDANLTGLIAGTYFLTISDANGCDKLESVIVSEPAGGISASGVETNASCNGACDGAIDLTVSGGTTPYSFAWSNGATDEDLSALCPGLYDVTISEGGASGATGGPFDWTYSITSGNHTVLVPAGSVTIDGAPIANNDVIGVFYDQSGTLACGGYIDYQGVQTAVTAWTAEGGDNGFQANETMEWKLWRASDGVVIDLTATYQTIFPNQGSFAVNGMSGILSLTGSAPATGGGSTTVLNFVISQPAELLLSETISNVDCYGNSTGSIDIVMNGGMLPYSYTWSNGATDANLSGIMAGVYTLTAQDVNGCMVTGEYTVTEPTALTFTSTTTDILCNGAATGAIDITPSGGVTPYSFEWSNGEVTEDVSGLAAGMYGLSVIDNNGCMEEEVYNIIEPASFEVLESITDVLCNGAATGAINLTVSGGTVPYSFAWSNAAVSEDLSNIVAGTYDYTVTDANNCVEIGSAIVNEPTEIVVTNMITDVDCYGSQNGAIDITVTGGELPYTFVWSNTAATEDLTGLNGGDYDLLMFDGNNCPYNELFTVNEPSELVATAIVSDYSGYGVSINGATDGSIDVSVSGGVAPYSFAWSNGEITEDIANIGGGVYELTITDDNNCVVIESYTITEPALVVFAATGVTTDVNCYMACNGAIDLTVAGGTTPYSFAWSNGANTEDLTGLCAGQYDVTVTDGSGSGTPYQPFDWTFTNTGMNHTILIPLGIATVDGQAISSGDYIGVFYNQGGVPACGGYIMWEGAPTAVTAWGTESGMNNGFSTAETFTWKVWRAVQGDVVDMTATYATTFPNQAAYTTNGMSGLASLTGSAPTGGGSAGMTTTASFTITEPAELVLSGMESNVSCFGGADGSIDLIVMGGTAPYLYNWSNGESTEDISGLAAGNYDVIVTDANSCTATFAATISQPDVLDATAVVTNVACFGASTGAIDLTIVGGTMPYDISWSNSSIDEDLSSLMAGTYSVQVIDANACVFTADYVVTEPMELTASAQVVDVDCNGGMNGEIDLTVAGGTAPYTVAWSNGAQTEDLMGLVAGTYLYTVTDDANCTLIGDVMVVEPAMLEAIGAVSDYSGYSVSLNGASDGWIDITVMGGTAPFMFAWDNAETTEDLNNLTAGTYALTVTDANGCTDDLSFTLTEPDPSVNLEISALISNVACYGGSNGAIDLSVSGGTAPYDIVWSNMETTEDINGLMAGTYDVTVSDQANNSTTGSFTITQPDELQLAGTPTDPVCYGDNTGSIALSITGGTAPISILWNNGSTDMQLGNLVAGQYCVTITDANGCETDACWTLSDPVQLIVDLVATDVLCNGGMTGAVTTTVVSGVAFQFAWSNGATTQDLMDVPAGVYTLTAVDPQGCEAIASSEIMEPTAIVASEMVVDVLCNGFATGMIDLTVSGGVAPYAYAWSNGAASEDLIGLGAGTYEVTITDANQCEIYGMYTISEPAALVASEIITDALCNGDANGSIDLTVSGGVAPYSFQWSNQEVTEDISGLVAGTYNLIITDANNCVLVGNYTINEPAALAITESLSDVACNGGADGAITLDVVGGTAPYMFAWSNSSSDQNLTALMAGTYDVTVTDANMCEIVGSYTIAEPALLEATEMVTNVLCNGDATGAIDLTVMGGTAPYTFTWSNNEMTEDLANLSAGMFDVTVTDAQGCEFMGSYTITEPALLEAMGTVSDVLCFGDATGAIDLTVTGGVAPYTYEWSNMEMSEDLSGVVAGMYDVTVMDANNCIWTASYTIVEPSELMYSEVITDILCAGDATGTVDMTVTGGVAPYSFAWSDGSQMEDLTGVVAGTYMVTVADANGCSFDMSYTITEPTALATTNNITDVACYGGNDGAVEVLISGGVAPYTIAWTTGETTEILTGLMAGTYEYTVSDANACTYMGSAVVAEPVLFEVTGVVTDVNCYGGNDGAIDISIVGGTAPFTYAWSDASTDEDLTGAVAGMYDVVATDVNGCTASGMFTINEPIAISSTGVVTDAMIYGGSQGAIDITIVGGTAPFTYTWSNGESTEDIAGLIAGEYFVTYTDANGCSFTDSYTVVEPDPLAGTGVVMDYNGYGVSCNGSVDGAIDLTITGGTPPYDFEWSNGETTEDISGLAAGNYDVTVSYTYGTGPTGTAFDWTYTQTDGNHIIFVPDATINGTTLSAGDVVGVFFDQNGVLTCGGYTEWTGAAGGTAVTAWGAENNMDNGFQAGEGFAWKVWRAADQQTIDMTATYQTVFPNAGTYTTNGLSGVSTLEGTSSYFSVSETINLSFVVTEPAMLEVTDTVVTDVYCYGDLTGAIDITVVGGVGPYAYAWSNGAMTEDITGLASGNYTVTISDANACQVIGTYTINEVPQLVVNGLIDDVNCYGGNDGAIDITVTGGTSPFTFAWSNSEIAEDLTGLMVGTFDVTVTDANGCFVVGSYEVAEPAMLTESAIVTDVACYGDNSGTIDLTVGGGVTPYAFAWSNGAATEDIASISAGTYIVTITDANNCTLTGEYTVDQSNNLTVAASVSDATCNAFQNGSINLTVNGGTTPYVYAWSNSATHEDISGLPAAGYLVTVTDANGCTVTGLYFVNQPSPLNVNGNVTDVSCHGAADGEINVNVSGGTQPYVYSWNTGATTQDLSGLDVGYYDIMVTDGNGCTKSVTFTVTQPTQLVLNGIANNVSCYGQNDGTVDITVTGGAMPYTYTWSNGAATEDLANLGAGSYDVTVTDANGCIVNGMYMITEPTAITVQNYVSQYGAYNVSAYGASNGYIIPYPQGGTQPFFYNWDNGDQTYYRLGLTAGTYNVTITDLNGCAVVETITLTEPPQYQPMVLSASLSDYNNYNVACTGGANGEIDLTITDGVSPFTFAWSNGAVTEDLLGVPAGTYGVTVTDALFNTESASFTMTEPVAINATFTTTDISCYGLIDGTIDMTVSGGTGIYSIDWSNGAQSEDITNLAMGVYSVSIYDSNNCIYTDNVTIDQPDEIALSFVVTDPLCASDGAIDLTVSGGTTPYAYNWTNIGNIEDLTNIDAGNYEVVVTDANGCIVSGMAEVADTYQLQVALVGTDITCYGAHNGEIDLTILGGVAPYSIQWDNNSTDEDLINLDAGTYQVVVTDDNNCSVTSSLTITEPSEMVVTGIITDVSCPGGIDGEVDLTVVGGVAPYTYSWGFGSSDEDIDFLDAGIYTVTVVDGNGCIKVESFEVTDPDPVVITYSATMVSCYKAKDGSIDATITGGTAPYTYYWSNNATTEDIANLKPGWYRLYVWDANGCFYYGDYIEITQPALLFNDLVISQGISCAGDQDAEIDLTVAGGTTPYTYNWNGGAFITEDLTNLGEGTYSVEVTDANGCMTTGEIEVIAPNAMSSSVITIDVDCYGDNDGIVGVSVMGGTWPFTYDWTDATGTIGTNAVVSNLAAGVYNVEVTDVNGCTINDVATIVEPDPIDVTFTYYDFGYILVLANPTGGSGAYSYLWQPSGFTAPFIKNVSAGDEVTLYITDGKGCTFDTTFTINPPAPTVAPTANNSNSTQTFNLFENDAQALVYPNPNSTGLFYVSVQSKDEVSSMDVYDSNGRLVSSSYEKDTDGDIQLKIEDVSKGIYYLRISDNAKKVIVKKLIVTQ